MQTKEELLSQLENIPYIERVQRMIALGRESKQDPKAAERITQLWLGDPYERRLALYSCYGSSDGERVLAAVSDSSRLVRSLSFSMIAPICDDAQSLAALEIAYSRRRHVPVLRMLKQRGKYVTIDAFLEKLSHQKDPRFAEYSVFASPQRFSQWMESVAQQPSAVFWQRVLMRYPLEVAGHLIKQISAATDGLQTKTKLILSRSLPVLTKRNPKETLPLIEALIVAGAPDWKPHLSALFLKMPVEVFALAQKYKLNFKGLPFYRVIHQLEKPQLFFLLREHRTLLGDPAAWFYHFAATERHEKTKRWLEENPKVLELWQDGFPKEPTWGVLFFQFLPQDPETLEERTRLYELWSIAVRDNKGILSLHSFYIIPRHFQEREARRHLTEVRALETQPIQRLQYCQFLPWQEAQEHIRPWLHHPEAPIRAAVLSLYLRLLAHQESFEVEDTLALVTKRKFEADPVRCAMIAALCSWPHRHWQREHLGTIQQIIKDALDASDLSYSSVSYLVDLARVFISLDPIRAFDWLIQMDKVRRGVEKSTFGEGKTPDEIKLFAADCMRFAERLIPGREQQLLSLLHSFREHVHLLPKIEALLATIDYTKLHLSLQISWLSLLNQYFPKLMTSALPAVLKASHPKHKPQLILGLLQQAQPEHLRGTLLVEIASYTLEQTEPQALLEVLLPLYRKSTEQARALIPKLSTKLPQSSWEAIVGQLIAKTSFFQPEAMFELCQDLLHKTESSALADSLIQLMLSHHKKRFVQDLPALLAKDPSYGTLPSLLNYLSWSQQHFLWPYLGDKPITGKFAPKEGWLPGGAPRSLYKWSRGQQQRLSAVLDAKLIEPDRDIPSALSLLALRVELTYTSASQVIGLTSDARPPIREKSIRLLSRLDAGQGVSSLLECLGDERARFAVYGFRKTVLELPPLTAIELLKKTPTHKVTVAKELFRLLGEIRAEEGYQLLISLYSPTLHRDARIAHLRALWEHLERQETWEVFARAAADPDWFVAVKLADTPTERLTAFSEMKLAEIFAALLQRPEPEARISLLGRAAVIPIEDKERLLLKSCLARLGSKYLDECAAAASAVFQRAQGRDVEPVVGHIKAILPYRRQLSIVLAKLLEQLKEQSREQRNIAHGLLLLLLQDELLTTPAVRLLSALDSTQILIDIARQLSAQNKLHADVILALYQAIHKLSVADSELVELAFSVEGDPILRRLALEALVQSAKSGWTKMRQRRLALFQQDASPLVASVAQFIFA